MCVCGGVESGVTTSSLAPDASDHGCGPVDMHRSSCATWVGREPLRLVRERTSRQCSTDRGIPVSRHLGKAFSDNPIVRRVRVLLVEDHDFTRSTVAAALRSENCVVSSVPTARDAMAAAQEQDVDCALVDLNLGPGPNGIDVAYGLREEDPSVGIVIMTTYEDPRLLAGAQRALPSGALYVVKSDLRSTAQMRAAIDSAMSQACAKAGRTTRRLPLSDTQIEILRMVAEGLTNAEIAKRRVVTERAVQTALTRILRALNIEPTEGQHSRVLLVQAYNSLTGNDSAH